MVSKTVLVCSVLAVVFSYAMYNEFVPPGSSEPYKLKLLFLLNRACENTMYFLDDIGVANYLYIKRAFLEHSMVLSNRAMDGVSTEDTTIEGVPVRIYRPRGISLNAPAMLYYHGGGWAIASINTHNAVTSYFAKHANMIVISVQYRLSPEFSQDDGLEDCLKVTEYVITHAQQYNINPNRVAVAGDSAGGNYAAIVSLRLRDSGFSPMPKLQVLIYPIVQSIDLQSPSYQQNGQGPYLTYRDMFWFLSMVNFKSKNYAKYFATNTHVSGDVRMSMANGLLNHDREDVFPVSNKYAPYRKPNYNSGASEVWEKIEKSIMDPYKYPLLAEDHSGLPEAFVFTAQFDPIRDDGYLYTSAIRKAGGKVTHYNSPIGWHGMINLVQDLIDSRQVLDIMCDFIRKRI